MIENIKDQESDNKQEFIIRVGQKSELGYMDMIKKDLTRRNSAIVKAYFSNLETFHRLLDALIKEDQEKNDGNTTIYMTLENGREKVSFTSKRTRQLVERVSYYCIARITRNGSVIKSEPSKVSKPKTKGGN